MISWLPCDIINAHIATILPTGDLGYALIAMANNMPRVRPYPMFLPREKNVAYVQHPEFGKLGSSAVAHRSYNIYIFNVALLESNPLHMVADLNVPHSLLEEIDDWSYKYIFKLSPYNPTGDPCSVFVQYTAQGL